MNDWLIALGVLIPLGLLIWSDPALDGLWARLTRPQRPYRGARPGLPTHQAYRR